MNGVHDMGGMHGMGPVEHETDEPVFHAEWERRIFALTVATGYSGKWNIDMTRYAREVIPPARYLATSYYEHWLDGLERLLAETGLVTPAELAARRRDPTPAPRPAAAAPPAGVRVLKHADVEKVLRDPRGAQVDEPVASKFKPGDRVRTKNINPPGHTRMPRYARGRVGVIHRDQGVWVFPDTHAAGQGKKPQHVWSVRFTARELWGPEASERDGVYVDLWDDYLDLA